MSRFIIVSSLVLALSSSFASVATATGFAKAPPPAGSVASSSDVPDAGLRVAPRRTPDRAQVRAALARARAANIARFRAYQNKGVFPSNTFVDGKANVWIDADGNLCAAATIIKMSGQVDLVNRVAVQDNFIKLADVRQGALMSWILMSGLTQDEIAAIQEPFMPVTDLPEPAPATPVVVDADLRKAEDARLRAKYRAVDRQLVKDQKKSLDLATDRLMKNPALAWQLVDSFPA
jgi:hypothetical protein